MISRHEILNGKACPMEFQQNLSKLLKALNKFREAYGKPMIVTSGYRTKIKNEEIGGAKNSAHCVCLAADFADTDRALTSFILERPQILEECGLWAEEFASTPTWVHLQARIAKNRIFIP